MSAAMLKQSRMTILLSVNAVAILVAGILIASAMGMTGGSANVVAERSDVTDESVEEAGLLDPAFQLVSNVVSGITGGNATNNTAGNNEISSGNVPDGELWNVDSITIFQTADQDICIDNSLPGFNDMYWQTSNTAVIASFYSEARTYLGYDSNKCRFPKIVGVGMAEVTAGTYDGTRRDTIKVTVVAPPVDQWKREVLELVNAERAKAGIAAVSWGDTCTAAANLRATEIKTSYSHTRPDGSQWYTVCPIPATGGKSGENVAAGASVVSPATVVSAWMNSPEHKKNILDPEFTKLAVGFEFDANSKYKTYWSQIFSTY